MQTELWNDAAGGFHPVSAPDFLPEARLKEVQLRRLRVARLHLPRAEVPQQPRPLFFCVADHDAVGGLLVDISDL